MKKLVQKALVVGGSVLMSASTFAQETGGLPEGVSEAFTTIGGYAAALFAAGLVLWVAIRGSVSVFRLANKFLSKAGG